MPELDWNKFTALPGAASTNFEMLWRALIRRHYGRFGDFRGLTNQPGVEFHLKLHSSCALGDAGRWYGWQCRWYDITSGRAIGSARRTKIQRALAQSAKHIPEITDWILCTRFALTAGDQDWFYRLPTTVRLHLWTAPELDEHLSGAGEVFRGTYFGDLILTPEILRGLHDSSVASIRSRWIPEVHQTIDAERKLCRVLGAVEAWSDLSELAKRIAFDIEATLDGTTEVPARLRDGALRLVDMAKARQELLVRVQEALNAGTYIDCQHVYPQGAAAAGDCNGVLRAFRARRHPASLDVTNLVADVQEFDETLHELRKVFSKSVLFVVADAGYGKTHLAAQLTAASGDRPAGVLLYGRDLQARQNLDDLARRLSIHGKPVDSFEALLAAVDAAGRRAGRRLPIVIDGLNEAEDPRDWKKPLAAVDVVAHDYPYVLIVCTLRREFVEEAVPDGMEPVYVEGFQEDIGSAVARYFSYYKIERSDAALPWRLLNHPLTLKMFCEVTNPQRCTLVGVEAMPTCLTALFERYIEQVADRIAQLSPTSARFRKEDVWEAFEKLGHVLWEGTARSIDRAHLRVLLGDNGRVWHASIVRALEQDGILIGTRGRVPGNRNFAVVYDALAGHLVAESLCREFQGREFEAWFRRPDTKRKILADVRKRHPLATDILNALVGLSPRRRQGKHLWPLLRGGGRADALCLAARLEGKYLDPKTVRALSKVVRSGTGRRVALFHDLRSARAAAEHPLNAHFLDSTLREMPNADRDLYWTEWIRSARDDLRRDLERLENRWRSMLPEGAPSDAELLRTRWVMWMLTSTVRPLRDGATRALYRFGRVYPKALFDLTLESLSVTDPYVAERMLAACYGVVMTLWADSARDDVRSGLLVFGEELYGRMFSRTGANRTAHALTRDYANGVIELATHIRGGRSGGSSFDAGNRVAKMRTPTVPNPFRDPVLIGDADIAEADRAIRMDFGNYTIGGLIRNRGNYDFKNESYRRVRRQMEARLIALGYSTSRFRYVDDLIVENTWRERGRDASRTDRYGKKYAWIAYFEMYGLRRRQGLLAEWKGQRPADVDIDPSFPDPPRMWAPRLRDVFSDAPRDHRLWMRSGVTPEYDDVLYREQVDGQIGPWALLEGYIEQMSPTDDRRIFTFLRGVFVKTNQVAVAVRAFDSLRYPGNFEIPEPLDDHYIYAGEIPWSWRFGGELRRGNRMSRPDRREALGGRMGSPGSGVQVEVPVCRFAWESYHSGLNQVSGIVVPAPRVCEVVGLSVPHPVSWTHVCATRHGVARIPRGLRLACDTPAFRGASTGCSVRRTQRRPRAPRRGCERPGRRRLAP